MNHMVTYLILIFIVGSTAVMIRQILFNLAGERFVARLRKQVCKGSDFFSFLLWDFYIYIFSSCFLQL